jgi:hypothetical protein
MIEKAILRGEDYIRFTRNEQPKGLSYQVTYEMLAKALNSIDGIDAWFEPAEKMTDYPTFDEITIKWSK